MTEDKFETISMRVPLPLNNILLLITNKNNFLWYLEHFQYMRFLYKMKEIIELSLSPSIHRMSRKCRFLGKKKKKIGKVPNLDEARKNEHVTYVVRFWL